MSRFKRDDKVRVKFSDVGWLDGYTYYRNDAMMLGAPARHEVRKPDGAIIWAQFADDCIELSQTQELVDELGLE